MTGHISAKDILQKIIIENMPFSLALKQGFKNDNSSKEEKAVVSAIVGCSLRHYIVMERLVKNAYPEIESEGLIAIFVAFLKSSCAPVVISLNVISSATRPPSNPHIDSSSSFFV